ncbi:hypothetical protein C4794_26565, partial [Salmonella enterica subsp. enterica serovar Anatum]|uniref:hypothetical protein n=1 Tax=Salmonella enterica TaxID=28901 RepID=UPI000D57316E
FITFGAFAALVYGLISIGGYVGDHLLGTKRTLVLGAIVLAIGEITGAFSRITDAKAAFKAGKSFDPVLQDLFQVAARTGVSVD